MAEKEMEIAKTIAEAIADLPEEKKQYFIGFAEGAAAMASHAKEKSVHKNASTQDIVV